MKIKAGRNFHAPVFHMQSLRWVWFLGIEKRILQPCPRCDQVKIFLTEAGGAELTAINLREEPQKFILMALEPFRENVHPRKFPTIRYTLR